MSTAKRIAHYVASTHWDREWYEPFQNYRFWLVRLFDELIEVMNRDPEFRHFQTDGQSILIEDYLEVRPEREADLRALAAAGRLHIGPWYVLPDEFIVSGESLVRNLQMGLQTASRFGRPARVGFVCDMFGHISQLPQILRGFSIDNAFLFRGTNDRTHGAIWRWQAADGSEVLVSRFPKRHGYTSYAFAVRKIMAPDQSFQLDQALDDLLQMVAREKERHPTSCFPLFDGSDHIEIEPQTTELFRRANRVLSDVQIVHSHLEAFVEDLRQQRERITTVFKGELREPAEVGDDALLLAGVLSSRIYLKQANARCENELGFWAEPFAAFADRLGQPYPHQELNLAWRYLLTNHPHDSMCGCSLDVVHNDMISRFDQSIRIARRVAENTLRHLALRVDRPALGEQDFAVVVFNPGAQAVSGPVDLTLRFPTAVDTLFQEGGTAEPKISFRLYDAGGAELPYQLVNQRWDCRGFRRPVRKFIQADDRHELDVSVELDIPSYGYTTVVCRPVAQMHPTRYVGTMLVDDHTIENEHLRVAVQTNGALCLTDRRSGQTYRDLLTLEDATDIGDGWYHGIPVNDEVYSSVACGASCAVVANGINKATLKVVTTMTLPREFCFDRMVRGEETAPLRITSLITLRRHSDCLEVKTVVDNTVRDHRLRMLFPTDARADTYFVDSAFDVVERPIALRADRGRYRELETETKPQYTWTAVLDSSSAGRGLAVVSTGLPESAVQDLPSRPIALTLFRSFIKAFMTNGNEGGQMQGRHEFNFAVMPLSGSLPRTRLCQLGQSLAAPPRAVQLEPRDLGEPPAAPLPASQAFLSVTPGQAVLTAVHRQRDADGLVVRMFNPTDETIEETVALTAPIASAERVDLEGKAIGTLPVAGHRVRCSLAPRQIVTLRLR